MKQTSLGSALMVLLDTMIWGSSFVVQSVSMELIGPFSFNTLRSVVAGLFLIPAIALLDRVRRGEPGVILKPRTADEKKTLLRAGCWGGVALTLAGGLQQIGLVYSQASKAGFLTALYVVIVPFLSVLLFGRKLPRVIWLCALLAFLGMFLLSFTGPVGLEFGDGMLILGGVAFAAHILVTDHYAQRVDLARMSCIQFFVAALLSAVPMVLLETLDLAVVLNAWPNILYAGIVCSGIAYTLQMTAQRKCDPTVVSLIMSLESVFGAFFGWLLLDERLGSQEVAGCALILAAVLLAQLPQKTEKGKK